MNSIRFDHSEALFRSFVELSEEHGTEVRTIFAYGDKWIVLRVEVCAEKPDLTVDDEEDDGQEEA